MIVGTSSHGPRLPMPEMAGASVFAFCHDLISTRLGHRQGLEVTRDIRSRKDSESRSI